MGAQKGPDSVGNTWELEHRFEEAALQEHMFGFLGCKTVLLRDRRGRSVLLGSSGNKTVLLRGRKNGEVLQTEADCNAYFLNHYDCPQ